MLERFTDRARKIMALANEEAQKLNHEYIGSEHLLLGLLGEGSGVGAIVLKNLDIDFEKLKLKIRESVKKGPDTITLGNLPQTPRAKQIIKHAIDYSKRIKADYIGSEHLLHGMMAEEESAAAQVLTDAGLNINKLGKGIEDLLKAGQNKESKSDKPKKPNCWKIPQDSMNIMDFLRRWDYYEGNIIAGTPLSHHTILSKAKRKLICTVPIIDDNLEKYGKPIIIYSTKDEQQIREAVELRELFKDNNQPYEENPSRQEAAKNLRESIQSISNLADRLEGIINN